MKTDRFADQNYLLNKQYLDASNLSARAQLHVRFSTNKQDWHHWVFDQLRIPPVARILELGAGPGWLWSNNLDRIPPDWHVTLSDFSPGMVEEQQANLGQSPHPFKYDVIDAQSIPFEDETFDAVIANHMLYHVPDRTKVFCEVRRVLKLGGRFYAATNGVSHLREMNELIHRFDPTLRIWEGFSFADTFTLENGEVQLAKHFSEVTLRRYEDALVVTEVEPLVAYILSGRGQDIIVGEQRQEFIRFVEQEMVPTGAIVITKDTGLFEAVCS